MDEKWCQYSDLQADRVGEKRDSCKQFMVLNDKTL
jgi:hypothetical protein